jgi:muramidase (phage lysozyme)
MAGPWDNDPIEQAVQQAVADTVVLGLINKDPLVFEAGYKQFQETLGGIRPVARPTTMDQASGQTAPETSIRPKAASGREYDGVYIMREGDSLASIAASNPFTLNDLMAVNPAISDPKRLPRRYEVLLPTEAQTTKPVRVPENIDTKSIGILDFIGTGEGTYTSTNKGTVNDKIVGTNHNTVVNGKRLDQATIGEVLEAQNRGDLFAVGKYQFIPSTFAMVLKESGVSPDTVFSPEVQDRLAMQLLIGSKRPRLAAYLSGKSDDITAAMLDFSKEWASVPNPNTGKSYYEGSGNKASHTVEETRAILERARASVSQNISEE